jgi:AraC-like DNA-binding protein
MSSKRHARANGAGDRGRDAESGAVVRALAARYPDRFMLAAHAHDWGQLLYASEGVMVVHTSVGRWVVPPHRAVWIPKGVMHTLEMRGSVAMRTLYFADDAGVALRKTSVVNVSPLLRELIVHCATRGRLDLRDPHEARLTGLLVDLLMVVEALPLALPLPQDPRALRVAETVQREPASEATVSVLARKAAASARTIERLFLSETGMPFGAWRRHARLHHALVLLAEGKPVTSVASAVGYASPSAFVAAFKATLGTTPGKAFG